NLGSNPLLSYNTRPADYGFDVGSGNKATCLNAMFQVSYELRENLFIESSLLLRNYKTKDAGEMNTTLVSLGIRLNMFKRDYDF
ncbi:MAG TPA: hypothetical protein VGP43_10160, partial [Chitinophagaceae bacterium]|nr:hypothetical protein [Chitinophagaceae bacterium]